MDTSTTAKVALVTGASSGIGEIAALQLQQAGFIVYAAARRTERMAGLSRAGVRTIALDVTDEASSSAAVDTVLAEQGRIDVLVNNAGYGSYGALEDVPLTAAQAQLDVNVLGLARLIQLVLPAMRSQRSGTIINVSSMGGHFATPLGSWYHASKYAVEGLSDALRLELDRFGIDVVVIEPGSIRSEWGTIAAAKVREFSGGGPYAAAAEATARNLDATSQPGYRFGSEAEVVAAAVVKAATARRPRTRYAVGRGAKPMITLARFLPDRVFDALIKRVTGVAG
ncbi:short-subunit dehydrogenase [Propionibacteriaceae bacterium ES.041]|uniref:oxidoreductase n=1 Tax=Enemella evansiae TaxID=2016499 RepID=UPI000B969762|nr:oxidoreductase [Enemella evansiae]OYN94681.1 short-chain dehydrogenase/reductase [Enemella evansiae]PFG67756.1 short-subunit dehydrogenase [Propionibacteriaceae bacterium ES.041]